MQAAGLGVTLVCRGYTIMTGDMGLSLWIWILQLNLQFLTQSINDFGGITSVRNLLDMINLDSFNTCTPFK